MSISVFGSRSDRSMDAVVMSVSRSRTGVSPSWVLIDASSVAMAFASLVLADGSSVVLASFG
jgi:hypothetical protein